MNKVFLKAISIVLVLVTLLVLMAACKGNGETPPVSSEAESTAAVEGPQWELDKNGYVKDTIDRTLGGREIQILMDTSSRNDIMPEKFTGGTNIISDEAYRRIVDLEVRLDCLFKVTTAPGENPGMKDFITVAEKSDVAGFDIICSYSLVPAQLQQMGLLANLNNLQYPQLEMPWWPDSVQQWQHNGGLYYVANNSSNRVIRAQEVVFANKKMITELGLAPIEQIVIDGNWTLEVMLSYAKMITTDVSASDEDKIYGLAVDDFSRMDQFYYGAGLNMTERDADGKISLTMFTQSHVDKTTTLIDKLGSIASTPNFYIDKNNANELMRNNQAMFFAAFMDRIISLEDGSVYMPVPAPKYDTQQTRYYTTPHNSYDVWCIPASCQNKEDAGLVIEAIASSDYRTMAPFFYEKKLKLRYSEDALGFQIFDIIRNSTNIDFGRIAAHTLGVMEAPFRNCFWNGETKLFVQKYASTMSGKQVDYENKLTEILSTFHRYKNQ